MRTMIIAVILAVGISVFMHAKAEFTGHLNDRNAVIEAALK